jgi:outer membrane protein OmpA-like peptidoglycan-associated protein
MQTLGSQQLARLAAYLREHRFPVTAGQLLQTQLLLRRMAQQDAAVAPSDLASWLGPILATTPEESSRFTALFDDWLDQNEKRPSVPLVADERSRFGYVGHGTYLLRRRTVPIAFIAALVLALAIIGLIKNGRQPSTPPRTPAATERPGATGNAPPARPPTSQVVTASGRLVGSDGLPVAHARLLTNGSDAAKTASDGSFRLTGAFGEPVLATDCNYDAVLFPLGQATDQLRMVRKVRAACVNGVRTSLTTAALSRSGRRIALMGLPWVLLALWCGYVVWKRVGIRRWRSASASAFAHTPLDEHGEALFAESEVQRAVQELRRPRPTPLKEVWVDPTVVATVENAGWFTPVYRARRRSAEYLILVDRAGKRDQHANLADALVECLQSRGVYAAVYYFQSDPRTCTERDTGLTVTLGTLVGVHSRGDVWLMADSTALFSQVTGRLHAWVDQFHTWPARALLTMVPPAEWGDRERRLADAGFDVLLASPRGIARLVERLVGDVSIDTYPALLDEQALRWARNDSPDARDLARLRTELRLYLGNNGFRWLAACAEYPVIEWPLTLDLGRALMPVGELEATARKLVRLPWFRRGMMPLWLRTTLLRSDKPLRRRVRRVLADRLARLEASAAARTSSAPTDVQVAIERDHKRRVENDEVWLSFLWGRDPEGVVVPATALRRLLLNRGRLWLGPRLWLLFAAAALASGAFWMVSAATDDNDRPQFERIALDVAMSEYHDASYFLASRSMTPTASSFADWCYAVSERLLGRSVQLMAAAAGQTLRAGAVSRGDVGDAIVAADGWSIGFDGKNVVPRQGYQLARVGQWSAQQLPAVPAVPESVATQTPGSVPPPVSERGAGSAAASPTIGSNQPTLSAPGASNSGDQRKAASIPNGTSISQIPPQPDASGVTSPSPNAPGAPTNPANPSGSDVEAANIKVQFDPVSAGDTRVSGHVVAEGPTGGEYSLLVEGKEASGTKSVTQATSDGSIGVRPTGPEGSFAVSLNGALEGGDVIALQYHGRIVAELTVENGPPPSTRPLSTSQAAPAPNTATPNSISSDEFARTVRGLGNFQFEYGDTFSAQPTFRGGQPIDIEVEKLLREFPAGQIQIVGHASDDEGASATDRQRLSQARAERVQAMLLSSLRVMARTLAQGDALASRLPVVAAGADRPVCSEKTPDCARRNRSVDLVPVTASPAPNPPNAPSAPTNLRIVR